MNKYWQVLGVVVLVSLVVSSVMTGCGTSPGSASTAPSPEGSYPPVSNPTSGPAADKDPADAIQVHGRWTIEVRNPDGTVAERREFENALVGGGYGDYVISGVLGRVRSVGGWAITLSGNAFMSSGSSHGTIVENGGFLAPTGPGWFPTLTISMPSTGPNAYKLVLSGTATAQFTGVIDGVSTQVYTRPNTEAPSSNYDNGATRFTTKELATPISLLPGQQVLVTVVISFS